MKQTKMNKKFMKQMKPEMKMNRNLNAVDVDGQKVNVVDEARDEDEQKVK